MRVNKYNSECPKQAVNSLFYIKNHSDDDPTFQEQCQEMINLLFEKFPGLMPLPSRSLTEQGNDVTDYIAIAIRA
jgi:hypothetical protein